MGKVHLIGNAHIDPVWLWRKPEGLSEIMSTFRSALDRMKEFPEYVFVSACAYYYKWVGQIDPDMLEEIKQRVAEERWIIAGGFWVQPDCNIPSGEAMVRHTLYSQRLFHKYFGRIARFGYNVDSFGHNGMFPQILKKAGMDCYIYMRPSKKESEIHNPIPFDAFNWQSPDGSEVVAARLPMAYCTADRVEDSEDDAVVKARSLKQQATDGPVLCFHGVGNHGGGPTVRSLKGLTALTQADDQIVFSSPTAYFAELDKESLPTISTDLQHHASGCYSANSAVKAANRRAENELVSAEIYDLMAHRLLGTPTATEAIGVAWQEVLFNQFHDILAGCSIKSAYVDALNAFGAARNAASELRNLACQRISWNIRTAHVNNRIPRKTCLSLWEVEGEGAPVVVFNPLSFNVRTPLRINATIAGITDANGSPVPFQHVRGEQTNFTDKLNTLFIADIPAFGYATYYVYNRNAFEAGYASTLKVSDTSLENEYLRVCIDPIAGAICEFTDKTTGQNLAAEGMGKCIAVDDTEADTWSHAIFTFDKALGTFGNASLSLVEKGPLRATIRVTTEYEHSRLEQTYTLSAEARELGVHCRMFVNDTHRMYKLAFPLNAWECKAIYSMPYGFIEKPTNGMEEPAQAWAAVTGKCSGTGGCSETDGEVGIAIINDGKYSFSAKDNELRMVIARSCAYADHFGVRDELLEYQDMGEQSFVYRIRPFSRERIAETVKSAAMLNNPMHVIFDTHHDGSLEPVSGGIEISAENVLCSVLKMAEDGNAVIARFYEIAGKETDADVRVAVVGVSMSLHFEPQGIVTVRIEKDGTYREVGLIEEELEG